MSLVIAFVGAHGAAMAGDMREIVTLGDRIATETLERELYSGLLVTDDALEKRAGELGVSLAVRDDKTKVTQQDGVLVGEVSETEGGITRKKRLCATAGRYTLAEVSGPDTRVTGTGTASNFVVLGNEVTKQVAQACIREHWKGGSIHDAVRVLVLIMERASGATASVSGCYTLVQTRSSAGLSEITGEDGGG